VELVEWNDSLSVGISKIDKEHQVLIKLINDLNDAMQNGTAKDIIGSIVGELVKYTVNHFKTEEDWFEEYNYPDTAAHKQEHSEFVAKAAEFQAGYADGSITLTIEIITFLSDWIEEHINGTDKKYTQFLNDKGIS